MFNGARERSRLAAVRAAAVWLLLTVVVASAGGAAAAPGDGPMSFVGMIRGAGAIAPAGIDVGLRLMIAVHIGDPGPIRLFDVESLKQVRLVQTPAPVHGPALDVDQIGHRLFVAADQKPIPPLDGSLPQPPSLYVVDLVSGGVRTFTFPTDLAGQSIVGVGYYAPSGRLYAVTQLVAQTDSVVPDVPGGNVFLGQNSTHVLELDAGKLTSDPSSAVVWSYSLQGCGRILADNTRPGWVLRSSSGALALPCTVASPNLRVAMVRVLLNPGTSPSDTSNFVPEYDYLTVPINPRFGFTAVDRPGERALFVTTDSGKQKLYVYDIANAAWIGSVPLDRYNMWAAGFDPWTGRIYMLQEAPDDQLRKGFWESMLITEGSWVPTPAGREPQLLRTSATAGGLVVDPVAHEVFFRSGGASGGITVLRDASAATLPASPPNPDARTDGVPEVAGETESSFSGGGASYGYRYTLSGGFGAKQGGTVDQDLSLYNGLYAAAFGILNGALRDSPLRDAWNGSGASGRSSPLSPYRGARAFTFGKVSNVFVDTSSAQAQAISADADAGSRGDAAQARDIFAAPEPFASPTGSPDPDQVRQAKEAANKAFSDATGQARASATWPYRQTDCVDFGGDGDKREDSSGGASARCQASIPQATGTAKAISELGDLPVQVGYGTSSVQATRDASGAHIVSTATAKNIEIAGALSIGEITSVAETSAHGRPGTARSRVTVAMKEAIVRDLSGAEVLACGFKSGEPCDPFTVAETFNRYHGSDIILRVPRAETDPGIAKTPGGAQALIAKSERQYWNDYYTFADSSYEVPALVIEVHEADAWPHVVQLAAVEADAHYTIRKVSEGDGGGGSGGGTTIIQQIINNPYAPERLPTFVLPAEYGRSQSGPFVLIRRAARGIGFALAHPRDGMLFALFWLLGGAPIYLAIRRRSLGAM